MQNTELMLDRTYRVEFIKDIKEKVLLNDDPYYVVETIGGKGEVVEAEIHNLNVKDNTVTFLFWEDGKDDEASFCPTVPLDSFKVLKLKTTIQKIIWSDV